VVVVDSGNVVWGTEEVVVVELVVVEVVVEEVVVVVEDVVVVCEIPFHKDKLLIVK
jgi:hypothetical protein